VRDEQRIELFNLLYKDIFQVEEKEIMMYPFMTLNDNTEITHSEMKPNGRVKVYIETPDEKYCFKHAGFQIMNGKIYFSIQMKK